MTDTFEKPLDRLVDELKERAKELNCLYDVQEILGKSGITTEKAFDEVIKVIPSGWQYSEICQAEVSFADMTFRSSDFKKTSWVQSSDIAVQDQAVGKISVYYTEERPDLDEGPFLREERRLINTIADQLGNFVLHQRLQDVFERQIKTDKETRAGWWVILSLLQKTDPNLLIRMARRMINYLCWSGIKEAEGLLKLFSSVNPEDGELLGGNLPYKIRSGDDAVGIIDDVFELAGKYLSENDILANIQLWIKEDQTGFLVNVLMKPGCSLSEISNAIERYHHLLSQGLELSASRKQSVQVSLIRRLLSDHDSFIKTAKRYVDVRDFNPLLSRIIMHSGSQGKLGGKGAGIFLAMEVLKKSVRYKDLLQQVKTPKTWYIISDSIFSFIEYNNLEEIAEHKYVDIGQVRHEYPYVIHVFKNSPFPPEIVKGLSIALDDFGNVPLIVRSSSLLEDQVGMSFAGKYKSLFLANQGTKEERLKSLIDAIAEVYASVFGPDPIEYRAEHGLIDHHEEMGILIQEVVGKKIGPYFFPAYSGVAFSQNEFRWSSRIQKEDGLVRIVPGLGTRAVDRLSDDYPILAAPGQPGLRVNVSLDEIIRYSPRMIDVINLEKGAFETIEIRTLLKECGRQYPVIKQLVSIITRDHIQAPTGLGIDFEKENFVVTFDGLFSRSPFLKLMSAVLSELQEQFEHPVDIEFACDGTDFYLLQCRSQSYREDNIPAVIPTNTPKDKIIFTANRHVSNGTVANITHVVYVAPDEYSQLASRQEMLEVGKAIGRLNQILPRRKFILIGPGRWGSRGDIKLGVNITYSDIHNTSALIEVAHKRGDYVPDLSFGTHFFQDLVEAAIRYIPLYPDDHGIIFNDSFLLGSKNMIKDILPDYAYFEDVIRIIDVQNASGGQVLQILMNAEQNKAIALLSDSMDNFDTEIQQKPHSRVSTRDEHWRWRLQSAETIAAQIDPERFSIKGFYVFGSTKNATAGPQSDIDILIHFDGTEDQRNELLVWLEGWSLSLSQINQLRTGYKIDGILDIHLITDDDIKNRNSYAIKIGAISDAAMPLSFGTAIR
jgi:predicted nucleotidyltransferase